MATEFTQLSADQLEALRAGTRQSGMYKQVLQDFQTSDLTAVDVSNSFPAAKLSSASQALKRYAKKDFENIEVLYVNKDGNETLALVKS
jgi:cytochrome c553